MGMVWEARLQTGWGARLMLLYFHAVSKTAYIKLVDHSRWERGWQTTRLTDRLNCLSPINLITADHDYKLPLFSHAFHHQALKEPTFNTVYKSFTAILALCPSPHQQWIIQVSMGTQIVYSCLSVYLWPPYGIEQAIIFSLCGFFYLSIHLSSSFFSSPNLSRHRLDVCHTCTHGVALLWI